MKWFELGHESSVDAMLEATPKPWQRIVLDYFCWQRMFAVGALTVVAVWVLLANVL
jgi:hypothetical protein